jgi:hypothetical protein
MSTPPGARGVVNVAEINPHAPRPYTFTEAALCLRDAIRAAGYDSEIHVNRADTSQRCIVLGALPPNLPAVDQLDARKTAVYNFEQLASGPLAAGPQYVPWLRRWLVADYHSRNIAWLRRESGGEQRVLELPLVPSEAIAFHPEMPREPSVDVLFFGTLNERRERLIDALRAAGMSVEVVVGAFAGELTPAIKRARIVLHAHFYSSGLFPVARVLQPVVQGVPVVCEKSVFSELADWTHSGIAFAPYEGLVEACEDLLGRPDEQQWRIEQARAFAAAIDFATPFERLLAALAQAPEDETPHDEIAAILAQEAQQLPPEAHVTPQPFKLVERHPGEGKYGVWAVWLLIAFSLYTIWMTMRS